MISSKARFQLGRQLMTRLWPVLFVALLASACAAGNEISAVKATEIEYPEGLSVISRADWGWQALNEAIPEHTIERITIHHGGEEFPDDRDPMEYLRNLQSWSQTERPWIDIPYHFMIDLQGRIYETRPINYPGDTNTSYNPAGHALISVMGNYENRKLSDDQLNSLVRLSAFLAGYYDVPVEEIRGHKDYADTLCPGEDLYGYLEDGTIRERVRELIARAN
jgi:N-acetylmuramoyl-L-alanine amidase-like protein